MNAVIQRFVALPLRYAVRQVLQRPWLKKHMRQLLTRLPRLHGYLMRVMFHLPSRGKRPVHLELTDLSPHAQRIHRALKQAIRSRRS